MELPLIDVTLFLKDKDAAKTECLKAAKALSEYGALLLKDPRVNEHDNAVFIDLMERYFEQSDEQKRKDIREDFHFQVGVTPEFVEQPRCVQDKKCQDLLAALPDDDKGHLPTGPDPKWRFFWRIGERPKHTEFSELNAEAVVPEAFPEWRSVMDRWGTLMMQSVTTISEMVALGFDMPVDTFTRMAHLGPHLLAPTGSDLKKYNALGTVFAGFHYDINFLTIHGKSRFPGLYIWRKDMKKMAVKVPDGCLLVQAGKEMEYLTGGVVEAGYHEVLVTDATLKAMAQAETEKRSLWRISSTLFMHIASDHLLHPLPPFKENPNYPPKKAGQMLNEELELIGIKY